MRALWTWMALTLGEAQASAVPALSELVLETTEKEGTDQCRGRLITENRRTRRRPMDRITIKNAVRGVKVISTRHSPKQKIGNTSDSVHCEELSVDAERIR